LQFATATSGAWYDVETVEFDDICEILKEAEKALGVSDGEDVEMMCTDFEGFPRSMYSESLTEDTYTTIRAYVQLSDDEKEAFEWLVDCRNMSEEDAMERYEEVSIYRSTESSFKDHPAAYEYAYDYIEETAELSDFAKQYFDYEQFAADLLSAGDIEEIDRSSIVTNPQDF